MVVPLNGWGFAEANDGELLSPVFDVTVPRRGRLFDSDKYLMSASRVSLNSRGSGDGTFRQPYNSSRQPHYGIERDSKCHTRRGL